jgi:predicted enzyme related to lactoylglutathione lyase
MNLKSMDLAWITVKDVKEAIKFYTETVGLKLTEFNEKFGWAELELPAGGAKLGIAQTCPESKDDQPGQNAILTFTVKDLDIAIADMLSKQAKSIGEVIDIPGHVKMQTFSDQDGNRFQLVQVYHACAHC